MRLSGLVLVGGALTSRVLPFTPSLIADVLVFARAAFCATSGCIESDADFCSRGSVCDRVRGGTQSCQDCWFVESKGLALLERSRRT